MLPFGELLNPESRSPNDQKFTSYIRDLQTALDYAIARYHTSPYGRFMGPDNPMAGVDLTDLSPDLMGRCLHLRHTGGNAITQTVRLLESGRQVKPSAIVWQRTRILTV